MPSEAKWQLAEGIALLLVAPWLLFPSLAPPLSAAALLGLATVWIATGLRRRCVFPPTPLNLALLLWSLMLLVGTLVSVDPDLSLPKLTGLLLGLAVVRFLAQTPAGSRWRDTQLVAFLAIGAGLLLLGVLTVDWTVKTPALATIVTRLPAPLLRLPGTGAEGAHANQLAGSLLLLVPLAGAVATGQYLSRPLRLGAAALFFLGLLLLLLSQSRAGWLGGLAGTFSLGLLLVWQRAPTGSTFRRLLLLIGIVTLATVVLLLALSPLRLRAALEEPDIKTAMGSLSTIEFRLEVWRWGVVAAGDFPFTGVGLGAFRRVAPRLYPLDIPPGYDIAHAHNIFLQVALDVGLPGLIAYLALLLGVALCLWRATANPCERPLANSLLAALIAFHVYGLADALAPGSKPGLLFWYVLGQALALSHER